MDGSRLLELLRCPSCGSSPRLAQPHCPGCGRGIRASGGGLDLLADDRRVDADRFDEQYRALRAREGWADATGSETPDGTKRWRDRRAAGERIASVVQQQLAGDRRPVVVDVGAGGGWIADLLRAADVMAVDLMDVPRAAGHALRIRGDMCDLPLRDGVADAVLYSAALHYGPVRDVTKEAARVLDSRGLLVVAESPIYPDPPSRDSAVRRSDAYYAGAGFPDLARHYFPIELGELRDALDRAGFAVERLDSPPRRRYGLLRRLLGHRTFPLIVARLTT